MLSALNVKQNRFCNLDANGHVIRSRSCWKMPEYDEKMDYILIDDYDLTYEHDKWVLIEEIRNFQSIIEDFMEFPVSSEKEIRSQQMSKDVEKFLIRQQRLVNFDSLLSNVENAELDQLSKCSIDYRNKNADISDSNCPYWGEWKASPCSKSCGPGTRTIIRKCIQGDTEVNANECQKEYPDQQEFMKLEHCTDVTFCSFDSWGSWSNCDKTCGTGTQTRRRNCPSNSCSGSEIEKRHCNRQKCPYWSDWLSSTCSNSCGPGTKILSRKCFYNDIEVAASFCQKENPDQQIFEKVESCTEETYCSFESWGQWGRCSQSCGTGTQKRLRNCPSNSCSGSEIETQICNQHRCPYWDQWVGGSCSETCGSGKKTFTRKCLYNHREVNVGLCQKTWRGNPQQQKSTKTEFCRVRDCYRWSSKHIY